MDEQTRIRLWIAGILFFFLLVIMAMTRNPNSRWWLHWQAALFERSMRQKAAIAFAAVMELVGQPIKRRRVSVSRQDIKTGHVVVYQCSIQLNQGRLATGGYTELDQGTFMVVKLFLPNDLAKYVYHEFRLNPGTLTWEPFTATEEQLLTLLA